MKYMRMIALLLAGSFFLGGCGGKIRRGVEVNGVKVGGMTYAEGAKLVRDALVYLPLTVRTPDGEFFAELDYSDDVDSLLRGAKRDGKYTATVRREWIALEEVLDMVCRDHAKEGKDAQLVFGADGFGYIPETNGISCDYHKLVADAVLALKEGKTEIALSCREVSPEVTEEKLRARTRLLATFSTKYDPSNGPRSRNIALAAERISGTEIESGEEFSFNGKVGKRTAENGFEEANVILEGDFVPGVGGGVCQTSTTLFGAALRAGLTVTESRPHSLSVGYVPPSQDAMVSEYSDLKFVNPYPYPVYLLGRAEDGVVEFSFYGMPDGLRYEVESEVLFRLEPPPARVVEGSEDRTLRAGKAGLASESYLLVYDALGNLRSRTLIRRDTYACVQGVEERASAPPPEEILSEEEVS